jgi:tetrathionate reductase subunit B
LSNGLDPGPVVNVDIESLGHPERGVELMSKDTLFLVDADKCTGCKLCIVACKDEHVGSDYLPWTKAQPDTGHFWIDVQTLERGRIPRVKVTYLPVMCQHCDNAPCIKACPEHAIKTREDGLVWIDQAACTGCGLCQQACPYHVIYMNPELKLAQKCTGCAHRVDDGAQPRCAEVCPHDAIIFAPGAKGTPAGDRADTGEIFHPEFKADPRIRWKGLPRPWIAGTVIDHAKDEVLSGAAITALDLFDGRTVTAQSDAFGDFWLREMESGRKYKVEITANGFERFLTIVTTDGDQDLGTIDLKRPR